jgi:tRNA-dihydrouridine synthase B
MTTDEVASPGSEAELLGRYAEGALLSPKAEPFPREGSLGERLEANPFLMAPMAGVTDSAYRTMARAGGAALAYTEMVSVAGIHYAGEKTWDLVLPGDAEPDIAVQLFGSKPEQFREASAQVSERLGDRLALIDVNMACPVPKVTRKGEGSALLDDPALAADIARAVLAETDVPVTCKIRRGRRAGEEVAPEFARALEQAGVSAVAVHGRTAAQLYRGQADWGVVSRVAQAVDIPVIGSGDIRGPVEAARMLEQTGAAAVMVARGSYGDPWVFHGARTLLAGGEWHMPGIATRIHAFELHVRLLAATGAHLARARNLAGWYLKGAPHASVWRDRAMHCVTLDDYVELAREALDLVEGEDGA